MSKLSSKLDDMGAQVTSKVASIGTTLSAQQAKNLEEQKAELAKAEKERANSPTDLFNTADVRLAVKSYSLAAKGFEEYIAKFPKGALVDVATYKLGYAYYGMKRWADAGRQFALVLEQYPKSDMTASARLMYAMSLINMKKSLDEAKQYLESITIDFPRSPEAKAAQAELHKLGRGKAKDKETSK
jgi:tol-pal system protein YbgF